MQYKLVPYFVIEGALSKEYLSSTVGVPAMFSTTINDRKFSLHPKNIRKALNILVSFNLRVQLSVIYFLTL